MVGLRDWGARAGVARTEDPRYCKRLQRQRRQHFCHPGVDDQHDERAVEGGADKVSTDRSRPRARKSPTSGRATIYSVAERAGVSIATVSRVLSGTAVTSPEATEKVLKAAHDLAYVPQNSAKSLASARYQTHAVVIGSLDGPYYSEL